MKGEKKEGEQKEMRREDDEGTHKEGRTTEMRKEDD